MLWGTPLQALGGIPSYVMGVPVMSSVRETPLNTNREFM